MYWRFVVNIEHSDSDVEFSPVIKCIQGWQFSFGATLIGSQHNEVVLPNGLTVKFL